MSSIKEFGLSTVSAIGLGPSSNNVVRMVIQGELDASRKIIDLSEQLADLADNLPPDRKAQFDAILKRLLEEALAVSRHANLLVKTL